MRTTSGALSSFKYNESGSVAVWFMLAVLPALAAVGAAVDYGRASQQQVRLQQATDGAALAVGGSAGQKSDSQVVADATQHFNGLMAGISGESKIDRIEISPGRTEVKIFSSMTYKPVFMKQAGIGPLTITASAKTLKSNTNYEIAMVIDNSGSMASTAGGVSKMQAAKDAAKSLINIMYENTNSAQRTKISLVPFTLSVNVGQSYASSPWVDRTGQSSIHWQNLDRAGGAWQPGSRFDLFSELGVTWGGCFESRPGTYGVTDSPPNSAIPDSLFVPQFAPDEPGMKGESSYSLDTGLKTGSGTRNTYGNSYLDDNGGSCGTIAASTDPQGRQKAICKYKTGGDMSKISLTSERGPNHKCDARPLTRLSNNPSILNASIDQMSANGNTNLLEGFTWGWRTLSPHQPFSDGTSYGDAKTRKIMILLTDGMNVWSNASNHNKSIYSPFGFYENGRLATGIDNATKARTAMDARTQSACTNAKAAGIIVYTIGFSTVNDPIDTAGISLLKQCATAQNMAYVANNASDVNKVFTEIARNIGTLRIAQ
jgi:Flp pilus assembly protein TadG